MSYKLIASKEFHHMHARVETVCFDDGMTVKRLVSYSSVVADVCLETGTIFLYPRYQYSQTTVRQVRRFLNEYVPLNGFWSITTLRTFERKADRDGFINIDQYGLFYIDHVLGTSNGW